LVEFHGIHFIASKLSEEHINTLRLSVIQQLVGINNAMLSGVEASLLYKEKYLFTFSKKRH